MFNIVVMITVGVRMRVIKLDEFIANPDYRDVFYMKDAGFLYIDNFHKVFDQILNRERICIDFILYNKGSFGEYVSYNEPMIYNPMKLHITDISLYKSKIVAIFRSSHEEDGHMSPSELMDKFPEYFI